MNDTEVNAWNEFAQDLRRRVRWDSEKIASALIRALEFLPALENHERRELLKIGRVVAERSSKLAVVFMRIAPNALAGIAPSIRAPILRWAAVFASQSRETLIEFIEKSADIIEGLPEGERSVFLELGLHLASQDWSVSFKYFLSLPRIQKEVSGNRVRPWFDAGLPLIRRSIPAALAYYGLESQRSQDRVQQESSAVALEEVARPLKMFAQALTGRSLGLRPLEELPGGSQDPFRILPCTDGETIYLPEVFKDFSSSALNFSAFKLATAHQAGCVEFGTFTFKLTSVHDLFSPDLFRACLRGISDRGKPIAPLEAFSQLFPKKNLARDLFQLLEGARVDHCLRREYRGLKKEMDRLLRLALEGRPAVASLPLQEAVLECLLRTTVLEDETLSLPRPLSHYREDLLSVVTPLLGKGATVADSARATVIVYRWLSRLPNIRLIHLQPEAIHEISPRLAIPFFETQGMDLAPRLARGEDPYRSPTPLPHRGQLRPEMVQKKMRLRQIENLLNQMEAGVPLSAEALRELIEKGLEIEVQMLGGGEESGFQGLFVTDLEDFKKVMGRVHEGGERTKQRLRSEMRSLLAEIKEDTGDAVYYYDEWDYRISDYRVKWCRLQEKGLEAGSADFVARTLESYADLVAEVRKQFQMLKPERFKKISHLERGEEIDLDAAIEASVDRRAGQSPSEKIYIEKNRKERDFSTLFLLDMSASTDERVTAKETATPPPPPAQKKVIDIEKEALVVMAEALEEIGDEYAIFGFSGYGRRQVDFYNIKGFHEVYGEEARGRFEKVQPQRSTRMGPVIRHAVEKLAGRESKIKNIILISDGYPQDYDYGEDRSGKDYALKDTMMALEEAARKNIHTFCITVDRAGHDYLRKMCQPSRYLVIEETAALPRELPKIYRRLTT
jgi:nitric oxide reductase activation protein